MCTQKLSKAYINSYILKSYITINLHLHKYLHIVKNIYLIIKKIKLWVINTLLSYLFV